MEKRDIRYLRRKVEQLLTHCPSTKREWAERFVTTIYLQGQIVGIEKTQKIYKEGGNENESN